MNKIKILAVGNFDVLLPQDKIAHLDIEMLDVAMNKAIHKAEKEKREIKSVLSSIKIDMLFVNRLPSEEELAFISYLPVCYRLFCLDDLPLEGDLLRVFELKMGQIIPRNKLIGFLITESKFYFSSSYGEKYKPENIEISRNFKGEVTWNGHVSVDLVGIYGKDFTQIAFWRNNIPVEPGQVIDLWLEYEKDPMVEIQLEISSFRRGSLNEVNRVWTFSEEDLRDIVTIEGQEYGSLIFASVKAKGQGKLKLIALHDRYSRGSHGYFIPGGQRFVTSDREEIFCYFEPGDLQPPLNIFFSGYKTRQGFEGLNLMRSMKSPFLLIAEPRLEGGNFYIGNQEYESLLSEIIRTYMEQLNFKPEHLIMAGLSMGTFGALYYSCDLPPHAVILGKPLTNLGDIAANGKYYRPREFMTAADVMLYQYKNSDLDYVEEFNNRFWKRFDETDFGYTKFIVAYMIEDDYDSHAYSNLLSHLHSEGVQVYGKGLHGRHNDNTNGIVNWFVSQYKDVLKNDFLRET